jgi:ABC-type glycerol-3-phosphate transport system substrate-binding protein
LANHYCKYQGQWIGVPFQFPTKFLCYRNDIIKRPPASLAELHETIRELKEMNSDPEMKAAIGLQGQLRHPALYYEWLAFTTALGGGDVVWDNSLQIGEVILDSQETVESTVEFLRLFEHAHDQSLTWDWDGIIDAMASGKIAMCLPFSDTVGEINRRRTEINDKDDLSYVPFSLIDANSSPYVSQKLYGYGGLPLHIFTGHVMVAINKDPEMIPRETRFMQWFLSPDVQSKFSGLSFQPTLLRTKAEDDADISAELFSSRVAQEYAFLPFQTKFENDPMVQISSHQHSVLETISLLVKDEGRHPDSQVVRTQLEAEANSIRKLLRSERSQS